MAVITTAVVAISATVYSGVQQRRAATASRRAERLRQRQAELAAARERRQAIKNARISRASIEAQAGNTGLTGASSAEGAMGAVISGLNENLSFLDRSGQMARKINAANNAAASYTQRAALGGAVAGIATGFGEMYGALGRRSGNAQAGTITRTKSPGANTKG
jgi:hypothetical protein